MNFNNAHTLLVRYQTDDATDDLTVSESEIVFVGIIAFILICGCGCLSGSCSFESGRGFFNQERAVPEPPMSRDEQRRNIFSNSLVGKEHEWLCPICAFENRPRVKCCALCGGSIESASRYYDAVREQQEESNPSSADHDINNFRVTMVAPASRFDSSKGAFSSGGFGRDGGLTQADRQEAFMARRFNQLTLRQRAAHRRRLWQRRATPSGTMEWVRVAVRASPNDDDGINISKEDFRGSGDSFGDSAHMSHSPGFSSVLNEEVPGSLGWQEARGVAPEKVGPIKQRLIRHAQESAGLLSSDEPRSSVATVEVESDQDLVAIAALPFRRKQQWLQSCLDAIRGPEMALPPGNSKKQRVLGRASLAKIIPEFFLFARACALHLVFVHLVLTMP
jgi:hypothetical protein